MENKLIYGAVIGDILGFLYEFSYSPSEKAPNYTDFDFGKADYDENIFVGGDVKTGPKFVIDAIAQGH